MNNKILRNKFTKEVQGLYTENYKHSKKLKMTKISGRTAYVHGLEDLMLLTWQ